MQLGHDLVERERARKGSRVRGQRQRKLKRRAFKKWRRERSCAEDRMQWTAREVQLYCALRKTKYRDRIVV